MLVLREDGEPSNQENGEPSNTAQPRFHHCPPPAVRAAPGQWLVRLGIDGRGIFPFATGRGACEAALPSVGRSVAAEGPSAPRGAGEEATDSADDAVVGTCFSGRGTRAEASRFPGTAGCGIGGTRCSFVWPCGLAPPIGEAVEEGGTPATETLLAPADRGSWGGLAAPCSAVANACTLAKRAAGSLASAVKTTCSTSGETAGTFSRKDGGGSRKCCIAISVAVPPKGRSPHNHS